jgi:hypothetical protein
MESKGLYSIHTVAVISVSFNLNVIRAAKVGPASSSL